MNYSSETLNGQVRDTALLREGQTVNLCFEVVALHGAFVSGYISMRKLRPPKSWKTLRPVRFASLPHFKNLLGDCTDYSVITAKASS